MGENSLKQPKYAPQTAPLKLRCFFQRGGRLFLYILLWCQDQTLVIYRRCRMEREGLSFDLEVYPVTLLQLHPVGTDAYLTDIQIGSLGSIHGYAHARMSTSKISNS